MPHPSMQVAPQSFEVAARTSSPRAASKQQATTAAFVGRTTPERTTDGQRTTTGRTTGRADGQRATTTTGRTTGRTDGQRTTTGLTTGQTDGQGTMTTGQTK